MVEIQGRDMEIRDYQSGQVLLTLEATSAAGANLAGKELEAADLAGSDLQQTNFHRADLRSARLGGANLTASLLTQVRLVDAELTDAQVCDATLNMAVLTRAKFLRANLQGSRLRHVDLRQADLTDAKLVGADLFASRLQGAILKGADLREADLRRVDFALADLSGVQAANAILRSSVLTKANLTGANFRDVDFCGADMTGATFDKTDCSGAIYDEETKWPEGFDPQSVGARDIEGIVSKGVELLRANQVPPAIEHLTKVVRAAPQHPRAHHYLGLAYYVHGKAPEAEKHLDLATRHNLLAPGPHYNLAVFLQKQGRLNEAIRHLDITIKLDPNYPQAQAAMVALRKRAGNVHEQAPWHAAIDPDVNENREWTITLTPRDRTLNTNVRLQGFVTCHACGTRVPIDLRVNLENARTNILRCMGCGAQQVLQCAEQPTAVEEEGSVDADADTVLGITEARPPVHLLEIVPKAPLPGQPLGIPRELVLWDIVSEEG